jgi:hypothetical protein
MNGLTKVLVLTLVTIGYSSAVVAQFAEDGPGGGGAGGVPEQTDQLIIDTNEIDQLATLCENGGTNEEFADLIEQGLARDGYIESELRTAAGLEGANAVAESNGDCYAGADDGFLTGRGFCRRRCPT